MKSLVILIITVLALLLSCNSVKADVDCNICTLVYNSFETSLNENFNYTGIVANAVHACEQLKVQSSIELCTTIAYKYNVPFIHYIESGDSAEYPCSQYSYCQ